MKKRRIIYLIVTILFIFLTIHILHRTDLTNNVLLSKSIQIILILFLIRISIGCTLYIRNQYEKKKYSYSIIMNLGLFKVQSVDFSSFLVFSMGIIIFPK